jgi:hypothetical protein
VCWLQIWLRLSARLRRPMLTSTNETKPSSSPKEVDCILPHFNCVPVASHLVVGVVVVVVIVGGGCDDLVLIVILVITWLNKQLNESALKPSSLKQALPTTMTLVRINVPSSVGIVNQLFDSKSI